MRTRNYLKCFAIALTGLVMASGIRPVHFDGGEKMNVGAYNIGSVAEKTAEVLDAFSTEPYYNVINYGAVPNDAGDDTAAIQAALDAADNHPGMDTVYVPTGNYWVGMLYIGSDTVFLGDGSNGDSVSCLRMNYNLPGGFNILCNKDTVGGNTNIILSSLCFDGSSESQTNTYLHLVNMWNVVGLTVEKCRFQNSQAIGCVVQGTQVEDCQTEILNCSSSGNELGFYVQSRDGLIDSVNGILFSNCVSSADSWGFDVYLASNVTLISCLANSASNGHNSGFTSDSCIDLHYIDCLAEDNEERGFAVYINANNLRQPCGVTFSNCTARSNGKKGFELANACDVTLSGITSSGNGGHGISAYSSFREDRPHAGLLVESSTIFSNELHGLFLRGIRDSEIRSNEIYDNALNLGKESSGIKIGNGTYLVPNMPSTNILIRDNTIGDTGGSPRQAYGVHSIGLSDQITLLNNELSGNRIAPYLLAGSDNTIIPPIRYSDWDTQWGVALGSQTNDYDGDGINNFTEYAFDGDPTNSLDFGTLPVFGMMDGEMSYVYVKRVNDSSLTYTLESTTNLLNPDWMPSGYVILQNVFGGSEFIEVTNRLDTSREAAFFLLRVE